MRSFIVVSVKSCCTSSLIASDSRHHDVHLTSLECPRKLFMVLLLRVYWNKKSMLWLIYNIYCIVKTMTSSIQIYTFTINCNLLFKTVSNDISPMLNCNGVTMGYTENLFYKFPVFVVMTDWVWQPAESRCAHQWVGSHVRKHEGIP